jgi:glyoxylase-like metal-dependent hydrolase (beta-lactamase superfamily II)
LGKRNVSFGLRNNSLEIDAKKLKEKLDSGEDVFILDVRTQEEYDAWKLSYDKHDKTPLIPIDRLFMSQKTIAEKIPKDKEIITLCAHGNRSMMAAQMLSSMGYKVKSVRGGMVAWNGVYDAAEIPANAVRLWQLRRVSKGCMSYVIAVGSEATVIDSTSDLEDSVLRLAQDNGLKITNVIDTHMHADHVSGFSALVKKTGAQGHLGAKEGYELPEGMKVNLVEDGYKIPLGSGMSLTAVHAPGHTDGSMCFALEAGKTYLFTGDTLFVNGVGRPDLRDKADEFAAKLYDTYQKILKFPDDTIILPAHFDPSSITIRHGEPITDTVGAKKGVELLSKPKDEFVGFVVSSVPPRPMNYRFIIQINRQLVPYDQVNIAELEAGPNSCGVRM